jgi:hypothetical protein
LPLANPMRKLDAGQGNGRTPERLEAAHGGASAFDRSMILLNEIAKVLATPHLNVFPLRILRKKELVHYGHSKLGSRRQSCHVGMFAMHSLEAFYASARSQICFCDPKFRYRPRPRENCRFLIRWASSMPANVMAAVPKDLKPVIEAQRRLIAR